MGDNKILSKSFLWMAIGLLVTFVTGYSISLNEQMLLNIFGGSGYIIFIIIEFVLVIFLSVRIMKMNPTTAKICFLLYSFISGLTFSSIFVIFEMQSIIYIFLITALLFGIMAYTGRFLNVDLTKIGTYLFIALIAAIVVSLINVLFIHSSSLELIISIAIILIFLGITAYDVQKIVRLTNQGLPEDNIAIYGALELYLDFINLFIRLLSLFGKGRD